MRSLRPALALGALLLVAGCAGTSATAGSSGSSASTSTAASGSPSPSTHSSSGVTRYAALGDSYSAAPYVYLTDVAGGCLRSDGNYPSLLGKALGVKPVDVTCSGATSADVTAAQKTVGQQSVPAQIDAVTPDTDLVTLTMGGNDFGLFGSLSANCPILGPNGQLLGKPSGTVRCGQVDRTTTTRDVAGVQKNLTSMLTSIHAKAPSATVALVGYSRIASTTTTCPAILPATLADAKQIDAVSHELSDAMAAAAKATSTRFVNMYAASKGHDVCAGQQAWVNGVKTDTERAAPLHPFAVEQQAVADRIRALLG